MKKIFYAAMVAATALLSACNGGAPKASFDSDIDSLSYALGYANSPEEAQLTSYLPQVGSDSTYVEEYLKGLIEGMESGSDKKSVAHNLGLQQGMQIKMQLSQSGEQFFGGDSTKTVNYKNFIAGFVAHVKNDTTVSFNGKTINAQEAVQYIQTAIANNFKKASAEFMAAKAKEAGVKELKNGVLYKVEKDSKSAERAALTDTVVVEYEGKLANGKVFDSSAFRQGNESKFGVNMVIPGWTAALTEMPVGSTWTIYIPAEQAYGEQGGGSRIPPHSALEFKVTLKQVIKAAK